MSEIKETIQQFLEGQLLVDFSAGDVDEQTDLFETGMMDSFGVVELITFMEKTWGIKIPNEEIMNPDFVSLIGFVAVADRLAGQKDVVEP